MDIEVSDESIPRALRLLDTIIKALRFRNHDVTAERFYSYAIIGDERVKFKLRERKRISGETDQFGFHQYELTGEFVFVIDIGPYRRKEVKDGHEPVEKKVSTIIAMLELEGKRMKEERNASEIRRKKWEEQERIEREHRERQEKEAKAFKKLFLKAVRLHQANIIRNYIQTVEANAIRNGNITEEFTQWMSWAEQKVSWYDPMINALIDKRNNLVHHGIDQINENDLNFIKSLCEISIVWILQNHEKIPTEKHLEYFFKYKISIIHN